MAGLRTFALALGALGGLSIIAAAITVSRQASSSGSIEVRLPEAATSTPTDGQAKAYITGAVQRPGVYAVRPGDRVADLVEAAGGPTADADLSAVNFARRVRDEDQVTVPRRGDPPVVAAGVVSSTATRININTAPAASLETLPGIGATRAQRIVESRTRDGPFSATGDLVKRKIVPQSVYDSIKDLVDVQ